MQLIGLTGGIASGKTLVSDRFARHGVPVIDADLLAREVVRPGSRGLNALLTHFGTAILTPKGALDRAALREMIFVNPPDRAVVDETLHPLIRERSERRIGEARAAGHGYAVYAVPLLVETDQTARFDRIVVVDVPVEVQLERLLARDGSNDAQARDFMALKGIVAGPMLLRDFGLDESKLVAGPHLGHKLRAIRSVLDRNPDLPFLLIGDSGQHDPEVYRTVVAEYPGRIRAVYIRDVSEAARDRVVDEIADTLAESDVDLLLVPDTLAAAHHAAKHGWIEPAALDVIATDTLDERRRHAPLDDQPA